ncbi:MAG: aldo/keto reductase [Thermoguttaceae bacterium]|nr:aldo/keto reductase [Thermoguttaceae bacterium]
MPISKLYTSAGPITRLGFGMMRLPVKEDQSIDRDLLAKMVGAAREAGVNYFDTAYPYMDGASEIVTGELLANYPRESFYLADKLPVWDIHSPDDVERIFNEQLKKCGVEYFDFYLLHNMTASKLPSVEKYKMIDALDRQKKAGKIRHFGFSFHDTPEALEKMLGYYDWEFTQIQLNYLDWDLLDAKRQYEILTERDIPVAVMEPVRGGALATLSPAALDYLKSVDPAASAASWALRFAASLPNVYVVLSGMSTLEQVEDNLKTFSPFVPLSEQDYKTIAKTLEIYNASGSIPCTACRYCMDCPAGVDIPKNFGVYNRLLATKNEIEFLNSYNTLGAEHQAANCVGCGQCLDKCPQKIAIPELMPKIAERYNTIEKPSWFF